MWLGAGCGGWRLEAAPSIRAFVVLFVDGSAAKMPRRRAATERISSQRRCASALIA
jgi:hypothetical protein